MNNFIQFRKRFNSTNRSLSVILLTAALSLMLSGCYLLPEDEEVMAPPVILKEPAVQQIVTDKVRRGDIENKVSFWGTFMATEQSDLFFTDTGRLGSVNVLYGDHIKAGEVLAKLESENLDLQLAQLEISLQKAKLNYDNLKEKNEQSGGSYQYELEDAKLTIDSIQLSIDSMESKLSKVSITSPVDGIVTYINPIKPGNVVTVRTTFITVCDPMAMVLVVKESQVAKPLPVGKELTVDYNGNTYTGVVTETPDDNMNEKNANLKSTYTIRVDGLDLGLINLNDTASVEYVLEKVDNVLMIDKSYIRVDNGKSYVNVYENGVIEEREIETGVASDNGIDIEIISGLTETDEILVQ